MMFELQSALPIKPWTVSVSHHTSAFVLGMMVQEAPALREFFNETNQ
jgi:hypothetical protein